jgi:hypothetical protein
MTTELDSCLYLGNLTQPCCKPAVPGRSYCSDHIWIVYQSGTALRPRHRDRQRAAGVLEISSLLNEAVQELEDSGEI